MYTFELNGKYYDTDQRTLDLLRDIVPQAKAKHDGSAVEAVMVLGLKTGTIREVQTDEAERRLSGDLHMTVSNLAFHSDGFSFTVPTELDAYKAAYKYQGCKRVNVSAAPNIGAWLVQVYK